MTRLTIHTIAFGGDGIGREDNFVFFVPFTLPGEVVEAEVYLKKKQFAKAQLRQIIEKSPNRVEPLCPYFSICGGCQLQHASYPLQLEIKKQFVEDSLLRIGKIQIAIPPVQPSQSAYSYRRHISLKIRPVANLSKLGFASTSGSSHVPVDSCLLFHKPNDPILSLLQHALTHLDPTLISEGILKLFKTSETYLMACTFPHHIPQNLLERFIAKLPSSLSGWVIKTPDQTLEFGEINPSFLYQGMTFFYSPFGFVQNHPEQSANVYDWIAQSMEHCKKILDLYCGIGVSSLRLARENKEVIGIELNPISIKLAQKNAEKNEISKAQFLCGPAELLSLQVIQDFHPDSVVVNPPKGGLDPALIHVLCNSSIDTLLYISCSPPTLARDLALLLSLGFSLQSVQSFDMFPQTTHVETVAKLIR